MKGLPAMLKLSIWLLEPTCVHKPEDQMRALCTVVYRIRDQAAGEQAPHVEFAAA